MFKRKLSWLKGIWMAFTISAQWKEKLDMILFMSDKVENTMQVFDKNKYIYKGNSDMEINIYYKYNSTK
jgi:hypothetical protein